jgi:diazepam-binding inhibitor (GABA receptor modulating acyl-CoA-binding protein)
MDPFTAACEKAKTLASNMSDADKLTLYSLFKQATAGDCTTPEPGFLDPVGRAKWAAWKERKGLPKGVAKKVYADVVNQILAK